MHQISEFLEMGANIQRNSYLPGYYSTWNHNLISNGNQRNHNVSPDQLLGYYKEALKHTMLKQEAILRDQIHDLHHLYGRQKELMDEARRNELNKHQLKMETSLLTTALSQISSLRVQKTFHIPSLPLVNPVCSQISVSGAESIQSPSCFVQGRNIQACSYPTQTEGHSGDCELLESKCKKFQKNFDLELPADAYFVNEEELLENGMSYKAPEVSSSHLKGFPEVVCNGDVKQFLGTNGFSSVSEDDTSTTASLEKGSADSTYLYKLEEETCPTSGNFVGLSSHREIPCTDVSLNTRSDPQYLSKEFIQDIRTRQDFEVFSNVLMQERKSKQEWSSSTYEAGKRKRTLNSFSQGFHEEKLSAPSGSLHVELKQAEPPTFHQSNQNSWSERTLFCVQSSQRNSSQSGPSGASSLCTPYQHKPQDEMANLGSSCIAALGKPIDFTRVPVAVQAFPIFNTPVPFSNCSKLSTVRPGLDADRLQLKKDLRSSANHGSAFFLDSSFSRGSQLESKNSEAHPPHISLDNLIRIDDNLVSEHHGITKYVQDSTNVKSPKDINLNCTPPSCSLDMEVSQSFQATGSEKLEDSNEGLPWHRPKLVYNGKTDKGCEDSNQEEASDSSRKRIHGSTTSCEKPNISCVCCSHGSPSNANLNPTKGVKKRKNSVVVDLNLACDSVLNTEMELTEYVVENEFDKKGVGFGFQIDLNSCINGDELSSPMPSPTEILLEAPASPENKECSPPRGESDQNQVKTPFPLSGQEDLENKECFLPRGESDENQIETPFPLSGQEDLENKKCFLPRGESDENQIETPFPLSGQEDLENKECFLPMRESDENQIGTPFPLSGQDDLENKECFLPIRESDENQIETPFPLSGDSGQKVDPEEEQIRTAAESLASISSSGPYTCIVRTTGKKLKTSFDSLHWFAGIASAVVGGPENKVGVVLSEELLPDGMDYFEVMTLNLTETKVEECCCRSNGHKKEEMGTTLSLLNQPRAGRKRRGRQRKDFQSEILPSLVSLSRYEVTEDLQTIGGLIESCGNPLETRLVGYAAKFGLARGRRRSSITASTVTENTLESLLKQIGSKSRFGEEERRLIGWGEVTRRRRGQRYPVSKPPLILSQV